MVRGLGVLVFAMLLQGCAALTSSPSKDDELGEGLTYYLPRKDVQLTVVVASGAVSTVAIATTAAYPELTQPFVLRHGSNALGKTVNLIGVGANGLLKSSKATSTSGVSDAATSLGGLLGNAQAMRMAQATTRAACGDGTHVFIYPVSKNETQQPCGLSVTIARAPGSVPEGDNPAKRKQATPDDTHFSGVYYRQAEPYLVTVKGTINTEAIVYSPSQSPLKSLRIARTFFANGEADLTFDDGMPTQANQTTEGELVALLKLPANIIGAYFSAIGGLFDAFKTRDTKQADALGTSLQLELAKMKYEACLKAVQAKDNDAIVKLGCGQ